MARARNRTVSAGPSSAIDDPRRRRPVVAARFVRRDIRSASRGRSPSDPNGRGECGTGAGAIGSLARGATLDSTDAVDAGGDRRIGLGGVAGGGTRLRGPRLLWI